MLAIIIYSPVAIILLVDTIRYYWRQAMKEENNAY